MSLQSELELSGSDSEKVRMDPYPRCPIFLALYVHIGYNTWSSNDYGTLCSYNYWEIIWLIKGAKLKGLFMLARGQQLVNSPFIGSIEKYKRLEEKNVLKYLNEAKKAFRCGR